MPPGRMETIRQTKLDLAQWITSGIEHCHDPAASACLARYAAAQLESAAAISRPSSGFCSNRSLLRSELASSRNQDCLGVLLRVSRNMLHLLAGRSPAERAAAMQDLSIAAQIRFELAATKALIEKFPRRAAA